LKPGRRDTLIDIFDRHFVDGQEAVGMHVTGQFRDLDDPNRFVWMRSFDSLDARAAALPAFYTGPVWRAHRDAANDTMIDSDDALLLNPVLLGEGYPRYGTPRPAGPTESVVGITVFYRDRPVDAAMRDLVLDQVRPELTAAGGEPLAVLVTDPAENNFPALPLRDENVVVWVNRFDDDDAHATFRDRLAQSSAWRERVLPELMQTAKADLQQLRLRPTAGSHLR
jgi:hypothetical protein